MDAPRDPALLAGSSGPGPGAAISGASSTGGSRRRRSPSTMAFRATVYSHDVASPRDGSKRDAERQMLAKVSWVASSARPRSPIRRRAIPSTERA